MEEMHEVTETLQTETLPEAELQEAAEQEGFPPCTQHTLTDDAFTAVAVSAQGSSHVQRGVPCQDASNVQIKDGIVIAAVADGVGSCALAEFGSHCAVKQAMTAMAVALDGLQDPEEAMKDPSKMQELLHGSMGAARDAVEALAAEKNASAFDLASTLTLAVYDGSNFHVGHIGDDAAVVQYYDGTYEAITQLCKGTAGYANSVVPLQAQESEWTFASAEKPVVGYVMCTDGVLDTFMGEGRVYYPFLHNFLYGTLPDVPEQRPEQAAEALTEGIKTLFDSPVMKDRTGDDLTLAVVVHRGALEKGETVNFDPEQWAAEEEARRRARYAVLYPGMAVEEKEPPEQDAPENEKEA